MWIKNHNFILGLVVISLLTACKSSQEDSSSAHGRRAVPSVALPTITGKEAAPLDVIVAYDIFRAGFSQTKYCKAMEMLSPYISDDTQFEKFWDFSRTAKHLDDLKIEYGKIEKSPGGIGYEFMLTVTVKSISNGRESSRGKGGKFLITEDAHGNLRIQ